MAALTKAAQQSVDSIDAMLARIDRQKRAEANTEPGGYGGKSTHPSTDVDDRTEGASEGARSSENTADVKEDQGSSSVDSTSPGTPGGQDSVQMNIGTNQSATGEDPAVETESAKPGKEDPGSSHPARTDNDSLDGHKYASAGNVLKLIKSAQSRGTQLIAKIAVEADGPLKQAASKLQKKAGDPPPHGTEGAAKLPPTTVDESDTSAESPPPGKGSKKEGAAQAGAAVANAVVNPQVKAAQDQVVVQSLAETIDVAYRMAEKTATFLNSYMSTKKAMDEEGGEGEESSSGKSEGSPSEGDSGESEGSGESTPSDSSMGGAPAEGSMSGGEGGGGGEEQALLDLLAGGEGMGADQAAGGMMGGAAPPPMGDPMAGGGGGGMPPGAGGGMMPPGAGGGMPPGDPMAGGGMPPPGGGAGGIDPAMLAEALAQAGIPPEAFQALLAGKAASAIKRAGFTPAKGAWKPKTAEQARQYQQVLNYVKEVAS